MNTVAKIIALTSTVQLVTRVVADQITTAQYNTKRGYVRVFPYSILSFLRKFTRVIYQQNIF